MAHTPTKVTILKEKNGKTYNIFYHCMAKFSNMPA